MRFCLSIQSNSGDGSWPHNVQPSYLFIFPSTNLPKKETGLISYFLLEAQVLEGQHIWPNPYLGGGELCAPIQSIQQYSV